MSIKTFTVKSAYGWKSESLIPLDDKHEINVVTRKSFNGVLVTSANRVEISKDGDFRYILFSDFSKDYKKTKIECTEKNVVAQHEEVLLNIDMIKQDCENFYKGK